MLVDAEANELHMA
jgi:hypothetical protein